MNYAEEIKRLYREGKSAQEISKILGIAESSVRFRVKNDLMTGENRTSYKA